MVEVGAVEADCKQGRDDVGDRVGHGEIQRVGCGRLLRRQRVAHHRQHVVLGHRHVDRTAQMGNGNDRWRYQVRNADSSGQLISKGPQAIAHQTPTHCPASPTTANHPQTNTAAIASSPPTWPSPVVETEEVGEDARPAEVGKDVTEEKERLRLHVLSLSLASVDVQFAWSQAVQQGTTGKRGGDGISENGGTGREAIDTTR